MNTEPVPVPRVSTAGWEKLLTTEPVRAKHGRPELQLLPIDKTLLPVLTT
jgi:hypothetical protein